MTLSSTTDGGSTHFEPLLARIQAGQARVGVIGLGYVGLPLAIALSRRFPVAGFDADPHKIERLTRGESYLGHLPSGAIRELLDRGFQPTGSFERLAEMDAVVICVPTPLTADREPDLSFVRGSARQIAATLRLGQLVVLESTTYPGTARNVVLPILAETGLVAGRDFFLAYSPEREDPGNRQFTTAAIPRVVGGLDEASRELAAALFAAVIERVVPVSSLEAAEASKILENTYRAVNIALVNELKMLFDRMGLDVWEVIEAARTKPFGFQAFYPGPGLGGHCIPIDPFYLAWLARQHGAATRFIELAGEINTAMPRYVVEKLTAALAQRGRELAGSRVAILGMAYKKDADDPRESPGFALWELLAERGAVVSYHDPHLPALPPMRNYPDLAGIVSRPLTADYLREQEAVLIATDHSAIDWPLVVHSAQLIVDTRNAMAGFAVRPGQVVRA